MSEPLYRTALITGASAGLGAEYARQLAAGGSDLILVARRLDRLESLADELKSRHGVAVETLAADLSSPEGIARAERRIEAADTLDLLVNNAGFGGRSGFVRGEISEHLRMIQVHVGATVRLTRAVLPGMVARGRGAVVNVASMAAFSSFSGAMYSGTKAFLVMFSENLQAEVRESGVRIQALCPGMTHTEFHDVIEMDKSVVPKPFWMTAERVVRVSLRALGGGGVVCIPGRKNKVIAFLMRCPATAAGVRAVSNLPSARRRAGR